MAFCKCNICLVSLFKDFREGFILFLKTICVSSFQKYQGHHFPHIWKDLPQMCVTMIFFTVIYCLLPSKLYLGLILLLWYYLMWQSKSFRVTQIHDQNVNMCIILYQVSLKLSIRTSDLDIVLKYYYRGHTTMRIAAIYILLFCKPGFTLTTAVLL